ncbi:MAG TPA: (2Fe-2S)-binding protein [Bryobacteraceae bacterium]|jgi:aerobic-type carbon monoxide dehydrogenase small subunit (CoxS/CutS family)
MLVCSLLMARFTITINKHTRTVEAAAGTPLLWVLRDELQLTGTKFGCGVGICGACTVHRDNQAVRSCQIPIEQANGKSFTTIEGLSANGDHPCQRAWLAEDVAQCGYCQAGMIMTATALLRKNSNPTDAQIDAAMSNSICRCGTYGRMKSAIHRAAGEMRKA